MWPLGACLLAMLYFLFSALQSGSRPCMLPGEDLGELTLLLGRGETAKAVRLLQKRDTVLARVLAPTLARAGDVPTSRRELEERAQAALHDEQALLAQPLAYLSMVAGIAPMLGLFGTVWGMIGAFRTISEGGMGNAQLMAGDISLGLITTAAGLLIAIPSVIAHWFLKNRLQRRIMEVAHTCNSLLDCLETAAKVRG